MCCGCSKGTRSGVLLFLLITLNAASIGVSAVAFFFKATHTFQIFQLGMGLGGLLFSLILAFVVRKKTAVALVVEILLYAIVAAFDIAGAILTTERWKESDLEKDYRNAPNTQIVCLLAVIFFWVAAFAAVIGFIHATVESCTRSVRKAKNRRAKTHRTTNEEPAYDPGSDRRY
ncbi:hypothetical protein PNOK_0145300 [Pyrrhoderma noxium]|uniref:MARVEL domain-containing protein n=1 Tax=Pyrrhoderma noxium TaxID=2282107 RepID=A0A286UY93_9AGAM|nr:hypothetical protein PNOK_0145300 [Pyrrhoderma noxium]